MSIQPIALCIENCYPTHESLRHLRCCALVGRQPGLIVATDGQVLWQTDVPRFCELWVSGDHKLICFRPTGAPGGARVHRAGREVALEEGKPVVVMDGDYLLLPGLCYRLHVHGPTGGATEPSYFGHEEPAGSTLARFAAAGVIAIGTLSAAACGKPPAEEKGRTIEPVEVRTRPPDVSPPQNYNPGMTGDATPTITGDATPTTPSTPTPPTTDAMADDPAPGGPQPPIEVRVEPPQVPRPVEPTPPPMPPPDTMKPATDGMKPPIEVRVRPPSPPAPRIDPRKHEDPIGP